MDVFFQQEGAVGPLLFSLSLVASLLLLLIPFLIWRIVARLKQNGEKLQEINSRLERLIEKLAPEAALPTLTAQDEPADEEQVPFDFESDSEEASAEEPLAPETALNDLGDNTLPNDTDDDDLFEFDIPDHFDSTASTKLFESSETSDNTGTSDSTEDSSNLEEPDIGEAFDPTDDFDPVDDFTSSDTVDGSDELDLTETSGPTDNADGKKNLINTGNLESSAEFDLSDAFDPTDDLDSIVDLNVTKEQSDSNEFSTPNVHETVTAATLSLDTDFGKDIDPAEFASGPDHEFAFEFDEDLGELTEPDPISMNDTAPLSFDATPANFTDEEFGAEESSFTFETEDDSTFQALDEFPDIDFTEEAAADFVASEIETEKDQFKPSLGAFSDTDFIETETADIDKTFSDTKDQLQGLADVTIDRESFVASTKETKKEAAGEDFAAAFDEIEPSLSSESLDDIAASILKDQATPDSFEMEPAPSIEIKPEPVPEIQPEPTPIPEIKPVPQPAPKPATLFARCEGCNHKLAYKETLSGKRVRCPACSVAFKLP